MEQINQSTVSVNMSVDSTECAATYLVNADQIGDEMVLDGSNPSLPVTISGLDVCSYSYNLTGYVMTAGGVVGNMSSPLIFTANLSG